MLMISLYAASAFSADSGTITFVGQIVQSTLATRATVTQDATTSNLFGVNATPDSANAAEAKLSFLRTLNGSRAHTSVVALGNTTVVTRYVDADGRPTSPIPSLGYTIEHNGGTLSLTAKSSGSRCDSGCNLIVVVNYD